AEDGIRDGHVTGVQTCALPILKTCPSKSGLQGLPNVRCGLREVSDMAGQEGLNELVLLLDEGRGDDVHIQGVSKQLPASCRKRRSEERRVGKECRGGWWTGDGK